MYEINITEHELANTIENLALEALKLLHVDECVMSISLVDIEQITAINRDYRHLDKPTDVISFEFEKQFEFEDDELGDIFICLDVVKEHAIEYKHSFNRELCFVIVHGILHLLGYDHLTLEQEEEMFTLQESIILKLIEMDLIS